MGAGWYGCHLALKLKKAGHEVIVFEKNPDIFSGISGKFGIRLHDGLHYPRSAATRVNCRAHFEKFKEEYPELVVNHEYSIYALGELDADGLPPKVNAEVFKEVCNELPDTQYINPKERGYEHLISAVSVEEPSIEIGAQLREKFRKYLDDADIPVVCNFEVQSIEKTTSKIKVSNGNRTEEVDLVINATSYQNFLPEEPFPFNMEVAYQPCIALSYKDTTPGVKPFSFIVMDGWFPCLMPYVTEEPHTNEYILTHGKWTIMGSFAKASEAHELLSSLEDKIIEEKIKPWCEQEMVKFWPEFAHRFEYTGWKGSVLAKLKTDSEFRSAVTFEKDGIIHIIPGKVSNIFDVEREVFMLLQQLNVKEVQGYRYVQDGVLATCLGEITKKPVIESRNTCSLQTYKSVLSHTFWSSSNVRAESPKSEDLIITPVHQEQARTGLPYRGV
ncbi:FAD dependent oxidoreductase [Legionella nautarum]|uniref:FAD dependent oxidoreductase n=2 Tax=Legionella nautarum TaxID=45070 RepID=A0A0W0WZH1_9GAMM|nr:FAD dependent oxidoreductase [Legionella nautarum]